eukprot:TRINITY_DN1235_c0_g1_i1.p1 TRINITY_DN1235_c0_g1~~TRINITY_DN1235_c0_g1_i1.p1  ORF type:complete len:388 (-),score=13.22 TRINITY_DN1235_c0_g1_i1:97-1260(-)
MHSRVLIFVSLLVLQLLLQTSATCGGTCKESTECDLPCDLCGLAYTNSGPQTQCGRRCGANCTRNSDCINNRYLCPVCNVEAQYPHCVPHYGQTVQESRYKTYCTDDTDCCGTGTICGSCLFGQLQPHNKTCLSKCGSTCIEDSGCADSACQHCAHFSKDNLNSLTCGPKANCGTFCVLGTEPNHRHHDCQQDGESRTCPVCLTADNKPGVGTCGNATCGMPCDSSSDCASSPQNCTLCLNGMCIKPAHACGDKCSVSAECQFLKDCPYCINGGCHNQPTKCGDACDNNGQCYYVPYCPICLSGACAPLSCGMNCTVDTQCPRPSSPVISIGDKVVASPNCTSCWQGHCDQCQGNRCNANGQGCPDGCDCQFSFCVLKTLRKKTVRS